MQISLSTMVFINGASYKLEDLPFIAVIPSKFFNVKVGLIELNKWLAENTEDVWWICFHNRTVRFKSESDATHMKLVLG